MNNNKKFTIILLGLVLLVIALGSIKGYKDYIFNKTNSVSQNIESEGKCIITIQGGQYDVTSFRTEHPAGDVFKCGDDMTQAFKGAHKSYLPMIAKFKVN